LRFGEVLDFSFSFGPRDPPAWPATIQIILKNDAKCSFFELSRNVFSERFQKMMVNSGMLKIKCFMPQRASLAASPGALRSSIGFIFMSSCSVPLGFITIAHLRDFVI
jgi:hypothetical protein